MILSTGGHAWPGGVHGQECAWWGTCMAGGGGHAWLGGMCGGGHAWLGVCMAGGHVW